MIFKEKIKKYGPCKKRISAIYEKSLTKSEVKLIKNINQNDIDEFLSDKWHGIKSVVGSSTFKK
jgi:hypothetical protein